MAQSFDPLYKSSAITLTVEDDKTIDNCIPDKQTLYQASPRLFYSNGAAITFIQTGLSNGRNILMLPHLI